MLGRSSGSGSDLLPRYSHIPPSLSRASHYSKVDKPFFRRAIISFRRNRTRILACASLFALVLFILVFTFTRAPLTNPNAGDTELEGNERNLENNKLDFNAMLKAEKNQAIPEPNQEGGLNKKKAAHMDKTANDSIKPENAFGADKEKKDLIKAEFLHAWKGYKENAWGFDDLHPVSRRGTNGYRMGLTLIDSLDTIIVMDLKEEYEICLDWIRTSLKFDDQKEVNVFETTIRVIGGLLSSYALKHEPIFLEKARQLADKLMIAYDSPSGIPFGTVSFDPPQAFNPSWGGSVSSTSEAGSVQLELRYLSTVTQNPVYAKAADKATSALISVDRPRGLFTRFVDPSTGANADNTITLGARVDSVYEYFLKQWIQSGKSDVASYKHYVEHIERINKELLHLTPQKHLSYYGELIGDIPRNKMDHLVCFMGGTLALGSVFASPSGSRSDDLELGKKITETCVSAYTMTPTGLAPEIFLLNENGKDIVVDPNARHNLLRPETVESLFILWRITHDQKYRDWGWQIFEAFRKHCRIPSGGYSSLSDVFQTDSERNWSDHMESFFLGETMKYLYLLFSEDDLLPLDKWVFNTEAHPFPIQ